VFLNPVCHWAGGGDPAPLFDFDARLGAKEITFPTTAQWYTDLALPAPDHIWNFEESSGDAIDHVGSIDLAPQNSPHQGKTAWSIPNGLGSYAWKKCVEFQLGTQQMLLADNSSLLDIGTGSLAFVAIVRSNYRNAVESGDTGYNLLGKFDRVGVARGYGLACLTSARDLTISSMHSGGTASGGLVDAAEWTQWECICGNWSRNNARAYRLSSLTSSSTAFGGAVDFANAEIFRVGAGQTVNSGVGPTNNTAALFQIAYLVIWQSNAASAALTDMKSVRSALWWGQTNQKQGYPSFRPDNKGRAGVVKNTAGEDVQLVDQGHNEVCHHYSDGFSHASKIGFYPHHDYGSPHWTETDSFWAAAWVKTNMSVASANADLDDAPNGMRMALKLTASANNAQIHNTGTGVNNRYYCGFFYKRHSTMGSDVTGHFRYKNNTTSLYDFDYSYTATDKWQWREETHVPANAGQIEITIDDNGDSICIWRVYGTQFNPCLSRWNSVQNTNYQRLTMPAVQDWCKAAQGELEITFAFTRTDMDRDKYVLSIDDDAGNDEPDGKKLYADNAASEHLHFENYTGPGALQGTINGPNVADWRNQEMTIRYQWDFDTARFNGRYTRMFVNEVEYLGSVAGWAINGAVLKRIWLGLDNEGTLANGGDAVISRCRIWEQPWRFF
jgi:hypothetical protein